MELKPVEKVVTNWVVGQTKDVVFALMEKLVYPRLSRSTATITNPPSHEEQNAIARRMHAVVLLYNYYHRKQKPDLRFLDLESFCNLAVELKPSLAAFMKVTQESKVLEWSDAEWKFSLTEKAVKNACDIAAALDVSLKVPNTEGWPISKVAVLLIDSKKEHCKLQFGSLTEGVWSLFEKELDGILTDPEKSSGEKAGDKRKKDDEILQICYDVVRETTGTESNELVVLGSVVAYSLTENKSATQLYLIQLPGSGTISRNEQVPLKYLVEKLEGPLAEEAFGTWSTTEVVNYYHILPYAGFISGWLSRKDLCSPSIQCGFAQSKSRSTEYTQSRKSNLPVSANTVKDEHTGSNIARKTTKSSDETGTTSEKLSSRVGICYQRKQQNLSSSTQIDDNHDLRDDTKWNVELVENLKNSENTGRRDDKESVESGAAISSDQIPNGFAANTNKPADRNQLCQIEGTTKSASVVALTNESASSEELENALALLYAKREKLFSQKCNIEDTLAQYEDCIERIRDGGDVGLARRCIESIISGNIHWMLKNETGMQDKDHNSKSQTGNQSSSGLSGIFVPSKCEILEFMCLKNNWRLPTYLVEPSEGKFKSNGVVVSKDFKLASDGGLESSHCEAREAAAAQLIEKICHGTK